MNGFSLSLSSHMYTGYFFSLLIAPLLSFSRQTRTPVPHYFFTYFFLSFPSKSDFLFRAQSSSQASICIIMHHEQRRERALDAKRSRIHIFIFVDCRRGCDPTFLAAMSARRGREGDTQEDGGCGSSARALAFTTTLMPVPAS